MTDGKRGRGAPARGPFTNKRVPFSSRFTEETMAKLAAAAERDSLSISQKGELLVTWGLQAEDFICASLDPAWAAFRQRVVLIVAKHKGLQSTAEPVKKDLHAAIDVLVADLKAVTSGAAVNDVHESAAAASAVVPGRELVTSGGDAKAAKPPGRRRQVIIDD